MIPQEFAHLQGGATTVARCLAIRRADGLVLGFTDHDAGLAFEGVTFRPEDGAGLSALAFATGLSVDNGEVLGALTDRAITEADIRAGRWDGAEVRLWLVDWQLPARRVLWFRGSLGDIAREGGAFRAELRGLAEALNRTGGRVYQSRCAAVLGDTACGVELASYSVAGTVTEAEGRRLLIAAAGDAVAGWYAEGLVRVTSGDCAGLAAPVRSDRPEEGGRRIELWQGFDAVLTGGDAVVLVAGCDKRAGTCRARFGNLANFRGFPHLPGEDWLLTVPARTARRDGGALRA